MYDRNAQFSACSSCCPHHVCVYSDILKKARVASSSQNFLLYYRPLCVGRPAKTCRNRILFCKAGHISGTSRHESEFCGKWMSQEPRRLYCAIRRCQPQCRLRLPRTAGTMCLFRVFEIPYLIRQRPDLFYLYQESCNGKIKIKWMQIW